MGRVSLLGLLDWRCPEVNANFLEVKTARRSIKVNSIRATFHLAISSAPSSYRLIVLQLGFDQKLPLRGNAA